MSTLLPVLPNRPAVVPSEGGRVYISVHDAEYLRLRAEWKQQLVDAHPDRAGSSFRFRRLMKARDRWEASETAWYAQYGLRPPEITSRTPRPEEHAALLAIQTHADRAPRLVRTYLLTHPEATAAEISKAIAIRLGTINVALHRVRHQIPTPERLPVRLARVLIDGQPHMVTDCALALQVTAASVNRAVLQLRRRGFDILTVKRGDGRTFFQLLIGTHS